QKTRVKLLSAIALRERALLRIESIGANIVVNALAQLPPVIERPDKAELLDAFDSAIKRNPDHDFRISEMPPRPAHLPDAVVGQFPDFFEVLQKFNLQHPVGGVGDEPPLAALIKRIQYLAINIELQLASSRIANAYRLCTFIARKPGKRAFRNATLAA